MKPSAQITNNTPRSDTSYAKRTLRLALLLIAILVMAHLTLQFIYHILFNSDNQYVLEFSNRLDFDDESSIPTWVSTMLLAITSVCAFMSGGLQRNKSHKTFWYIIGSILLLFSIDEVATIHEFMLQLAHIGLFGFNASGFWLNAWWVVVPIAVVGVALVLRLAFTVLPIRTSKLLAIGSGIYFAGAIIAEVITPIFDSTGFLSQGIMVSVEEGLELAGTVILLYTIVDYAERNYPENFKTLLRALRPHSVATNIKE